MPFSLVVVPRNTIRKCAVTKRLSATPFEKTGTARLSHDVARFLGDVPIDTTHINRTHGIPTFPFFLKTLEPPLSLRSLATP